MGKIIVLCLFLFFSFKVFPQQFCQDSVVNKQVSARTEWDTITHVSENFICQLYNSHIDTILFLEYQSLESNSISNKATVIWQYKGQGFAIDFYILKFSSNYIKRKRVDKAFPYGDSVFVSSIKLIDLNPIISYYLNNHIDTITNEPVSKLSHPAYCRVKFYLGTKFYEATLKDIRFLDIQHLNYPRTVWLNLIYKELKE